MKKLFLTTLCALLSLSCLQAKILYCERTKDIKHVFENIKRGDKLEVSNCFGDVEFRLHNKDEIRAVINVKVTAKSDAAASRLLNRIDVSAYVERSWSAATYSLKNSFTGGTENETNIEVNWVVYIPKDLIAIKVKNKFGNVGIDKYSLPFEASVQYGNFTAGSLLHNNPRDVSIDVQFGNLNIDRAVAICAGVRFGEVQLGSVDYLNLALHHSEFSVAEVNTSIISVMEHSTAQIKSVGSVKTGGISHTTMNIEALKRKLEITQCLHSDVTVSVPSAKVFEGVKIKADFTPVRLLLPRNIVAQCRLSANMGNIDVSDVFHKNLDFKEDIHNKLCSGYLGKLSDNAPKIDIKDSFAGITVAPID